MSQPLVTRPAYGHGGSAMPVGESKLPFYGRVYLIRHLASGRKYIGCTKNSLKKRWQQHLCEANRGSQTLLHKALRKHGASAFEMTLLEEVAGGHSELMLAEVRLILEQGALAPSGYNLTQGGDGVDFTSPLTRANHKEACRVRSSDPSWLKNTAQANRSKAKDPAWVKANNAAIQKRSATDWAEKQKAGSRLRSNSPSWQEAQKSAARKRMADPTLAEAAKSNMAKGREKMAAALALRDATCTPEELARLMRKRETTRLWRERRRNA